MTPEDDIAFLEDFRDRIRRFPIAGTAPSRDPPWGGSGMFEMDKAMQDPNFRAPRRDIDRMKGRAALILDGFGIARTFIQHPPAAAGGPMLKFPLFDPITDNRSRHTIDARSSPARSTKRSAGCSTKWRNAAHGPNNPSPPLPAPRQCQIPVSTHCLQARDSDSRDSNSKEPVLPNGPRFAGRASNCPRRRYRPRLHCHRGRKSTATG